MRHRILASTVCIALCVAPQAAQAQLETSLTIGAVSGALSQAINDFKAALETAGSEVKGIGNSLQANAQNVLLDLDRAIAGNVNLTFDRLDRQQRALYRDAQALTKQVSRATLAVVDRTGEQARIAIADADILAYNASYSLPCRSQTPRAVLVTPGSLRIGRDTPEVTVKGNFLDFLPNGSATIDGQPARVLSRSANDMRIEIPPPLAGAVKQRGSVSIEIAAQERKKSGFLFFCPTSKQPLTLQASALLSPPRSIALSGWFRATTMARETKTEDHGFDSGRPGDCSVNVDVSQNICAAADWQVTGINSFGITSANCGSNAGPPSVSGARCVSVPGRLRGCGYDNYVFARNCRGRGWINWAMQVALARDVRTDMAAQEFSASSNNQASWSFAYAPGTPLANPSWTYAARVDVVDGDQTQRFEISQAQESSGPVTGRLIDGTLAISVNDGDI